MQLSYWEKNSFFNGYDVVVIGSGIVGLHAAIYLKEKKPSVKVMVIEKGFLPYGASTRNAGFACFGSAGELLNDLQLMPEDEVFKLVDKRFRGLQKLRKNLGDELTGYEPLGGFEVFTPEEKADFDACLAKLEWLNKSLHPITGTPSTYIVDRDAISKNGLAGFIYCIKNTCEGQIDTGKMMYHLLQKAWHTGVVVINGMGVLAVSEQSGKVTILTDQQFSFEAGQVLVATNGFAQKLLPSLDVQPARAQVFITSPIKGLQLRGAFHFDKGFYYFRNVGDRVLFGGGRNLDFKSEQTMEFGLTELVQQRLEQILNKRILPGKEYMIEQRWSGIMGLGMTKTTLVQKISPHISCAVRMGGMGVAIGSLIGEEGADLVLKS